MGNTVDGLISGMDTTAIVASMMQIEAQPKTNLQNKVSTAQTVVGSYQSVNTKLAALKTAGYDAGQLSTWRSIKPTVSSASVTAIAIGGTATATGSVTFDVVSLANAQANSGHVASTGNITAADSIDVTIGSGSPVTIDISVDKSAAGIAKALNNAGIALKASVIATSSGDSVLQLRGTNTGAAYAFTIAGMDDVALPSTAVASDAQLQVGGTDAEGGYSLISATNTFTGLMAGVTTTVSELETGITLDSAPDVAGMAGKFQALVDAANATLTEVAKQTAYDSSTRIGSPLTGDFTIRQMGQSILSAVSQGQADFGSLSKFGVQLDKSGKLTFDATKFTAAYNADPDSIKTAGIAFGDKIQALASKQSANVTASITGRNNLIDSMNLQIDNWSVRLTAKQASLNKTYSDLETALGKLKNQSTWLSGQISSLS
jgi:flagellar hook-associated protein 2